MNLFHAVTEFKRAVHHVSACKAQTCDRWGIRLTRNLKIELLVYLDTADAFAILSVNASWGRLLRDERACRVMYEKCFGECTARDRDIFQWSEKTSWCHRLDIRMRTMRNWTDGHAQALMVFPTTYKDPRNMDHVELDGCNLEHEDLSGISIMLDLHNGKTDYETEMTPRKWILRNPEWRFETDGVLTERIVHKKTRQIISSFETGETMVGSWNRIDCDPASDLLLRHTRSLDQWAVYRVDTGQVVYRQKGCLLHCWPESSILFDGRIYNRGAAEKHGQMDVIDARSGQVLQQNVQIPTDYWVGTVPQYLVFCHFGQDAHVALWDRFQLRLSKLISTERKAATMLDVSRRECLIVDKTQKRIHHVDVRGKVRRWSGHFLDVKDLSLAFNGRWLVTAGVNTMTIYDFKPFENACTYHNKIKRVRYS